MVHQEKPNVSLDAIASRCGVSPMTVSRALRHLPSVSEATRVRIFDVASKLGYLPTLRGGRKSSVQEPLHSKPVQIILRDHRNGLCRFHTELMLELIRLLASNRYECVTRVVDDSYEEFLRMLPHASKLSAAATLLVGSFMEREYEAILRAIPGAILLDDPGICVPDCVYSTFAFDNTQAAWLAISHLLERRRRRILLVTGPADHFFTRETEEGYRTVLSKEGVTICEDLILHTDFTLADATEKVGRLLDAGIQFDGVFTNDEMAGGVYRALLNRGLRIPDDVAICGCDGLPIGLQLYPQLTTIRLDHKELAAKAIETIMANSTPTFLNLRLRPTLILREST